MKAWNVIINEQDGGGGGNDKPYYFADYDDAHAFYAWINSLKGTPFYPHVSRPPTYEDVPLVIHPKGDRFWEKK